MNRPWLDIETLEGLLHARAGLPDRWDISITRNLRVAGAVSRLRSARQVRQDLWRASRAVRGFVPRVLVHAKGRELRLTGGGVQVTGRMPPGLETRLAAILDNPDNRRRWDGYARMRARHV